MIKTRYPKALVTALGLVSVSIVVGLGGLIVSNPFWLPRLIDLGLLVLAAKAGLKVDLKVRPPCRYDIRGTQLVNTRIFDKVVYDIPALREVRPTDMGFALSFENQADELVPYDTAYVSALMCEIFSLKPGFLDAYRPAVPPIYEVDGVTVAANRCDPDTGISMTLEHGIRKVDVHVPFAGTKGLMVTCT